MWTTTESATPVRTTTMGTAWRTSRTIAPRISTLSRKTWTGMGPEMCAMLTSTEMVWTTRWRRIRGRIRLTRTVMTMVFWTAPTGLWIQIGTVSSVLWIRTATTTVSWMAQSRGSCRVNCTGIPRSPRAILCRMPTLEPPRIRRGQTRMVAVWMMVRRTPTTTVASMTGAGPERPER
jgi:hypothetical protein